MLNDLKRRVVYGATPWAPLVLLMLPVLILTVCGVVAIIGRAG